MPSSRAKSCEQCRSAKARCTLSTPCVRCTKRGLNCRYSFWAGDRAQEDSGKRLRPLQPAVSITETLATASSTSTSDYPTETSNDSPASGYDAEAIRDGDQTEDSHDAFTLKSTATALMPDIELPSDFMPELFDLPDSFDLPPLSFDFEMHLPPPDQSIRPAELRQLEQRSRTFQQGALTAKLLFSKLASYSRIIADATQLPPFIHPPCWLKHGATCTAAKSHKCLPAPLAVCSNLSQMFYLRRDGSEAFVWGQICTHLRQLREQVDSYDEEGGLHALQAALLYGILCSTSTESASRADADWIVASIEAIGIKVFSDYPWALNTDHVCSSRQEWVLMESLRRLGSVFYLFDLLMQSTARTPSKGDCDTFWFMPLPSPRTLWKPMTDIDWSAAYRQHLESSKSRGLTLRHLLLFRQTKANGETVRFSDELSEWCEQVDDFSTLLWLALTVEGDGQSAMAP